MVGATTMIVEVIFVGLLGVAALSDLASYRIPNVVVIGVFLLFAVVSAINYSHVLWVGHLGACALCFVGGVAFYYFGQMGAGDVKLIAAVALWVGWPALPVLLFLVGASGIIVMLFILAARYVVRLAPARALLGYREKLPQVLRQGAGIPYGVAIATGAIGAIPWFPTWLWH